MKGIARVVRVLRGRLQGSRGSSKGLPSLIKALDELVPRRVMREVVASSHDRRQWGVLAAAWVGVSEREFFTAAAKVMGIELEERITPPDLTIFGSKAREILSELRRVGATVVLNGNSITRFIAVDPAEVRSLAIYDGRSAVSIASWSDIARALDAAERMVLERENNTEHIETRKRQEVCGKILNIVVREAAAHGAQSVEVITTDGKTRYQFCTSHGKVATGAIRPEVVQDLLAYLCSVEGSIIKMDAQGEVVLRSLGSASNFRLSWNGASKVIIAPEWKAPEPHSNPRVSIDLRSGAGDPPPKTEPLHDHPVLVVDDNPMFCRVLERLFHKEGISPSFAENGVVALEKLASAKHLLPKVILCDLHMPVMNGRELLAKLKSDQRLQSIPILMLTSDDDVDAELQLLAAGADAFVSKAKDPRVLTAQVQRLIKQRALQEAA